MNKPYANLQKYRMNHSFKKNHKNRAKYTPLHVFPPLTNYRIFLKFIPCFIDINLKYKNHLKKCSDPSPPAQSVEVGIVENFFRGG